MTSALQKIDVPLMERYTTTCVPCGWIRQFFGTEQEARESAEKMGWEFRMRVVDFGLSTQERAFCPHCKLLVKES
jgi:RNase P subunit RPR2